MKDFWPALFGHTFVQALAIFIVGVLCLILPDCLAVVGVALHWPLPAAIIGMGAGLAIFGFVSLIGWSVWESMSRIEKDNGHAQQDPGTPRQGKEPNRD